tara:strand:- start:418 stop:975 length:558 start_codon:yes stop_codon:yes gene_type:complete
MGAVARGASLSGAEVVGVVPSTWAPYSQPELCRKFSATVHARSLEHRRTEMLTRSNAVICLPGGFGTDDEFTEVLAVNQTYRYGKVPEQRMPVIFVNINGYYEDYINHVKRGLREGFRSIEDMDAVFIVDTAVQASSLIDIFESEGWDGLNAQAQQCRFLNYERNGDCFELSQPSKQVPELARNN